MDPTTNRISLCSGGGSEQFILEFDGTSLGDSTQNMHCGSVDYDSDGNIYMVGNSSAQVSGQQVASIWKTNKTGTSVEWSKYFDYSGHSDTVNCVRVNRNESGEPVYMSGSSGNFVTYTTGSYADSQLYKFTSSGTTTWRAAWGGGGYDQWNGMDFDSNDNIYLTGTNYPWQSGIALVKKNSSGATQWSIKKHLGTTESSRYAKCDSNDNVWWAGVLSDSNDAWVGKYTSAGARTNSWKMGNSQDLCYGLDIDASDNVYMMVDNNNSWSSITGTSGTIFQWNNASSAWTWALVSGGTGNNYGYAIACDKSVANGDVYGYSHAANGQFNSQTNSGVYICKRSYAGSHQWSRLFYKTTGGLTFPGGQECIRCDGEFVYLCGEFIPSGVGYYRPFVIKYPVDGSVTGTFGEWKIETLTPGSNGYYAYDNNYISSWSVSSGGEYNASVNGSDQTVQSSEYTGTMVTGDKEILS